MLRTALCLTASLFVSTAQAQPDPSIGAVVSAAGFGDRLAPGGVASMFGTGISVYDGTLQWEVDSDPLRLPTEFRAVEVHVNSIPAPLFFVSRTQINFQIPYEVAAGIASFVVNRDGVSSEAFEAMVSVAAPSVFTYPHPPGSTDVPIVIGGGGVLNMAMTLGAWGAGPMPELPPGSAIVLMLTGMGQLSPPLDSGVVAPLVWSDLPLVARFGTIEADIVYQGTMPGLVGVGQVNIIVPDGIYDLETQLFELRSGDDLVARLAY